MSKFFHVHRDPNWQRIGMWNYQTCRCGARRVSRATSNLLGPVLPGWEKLLVDKHGQNLMDSGWVKEAKRGR